MADETPAATAEDTLMVPETLDAPEEEQMPAPGSDVSDRERTLSGNHGSAAIPEDHDDADGHSVAESSSESSKRFAQDERAAPHFSGAAMGDQGDDDPAPDDRSPADRDRSGSIDDGSQPGEVEASLPESESSPAESSTAGSGRPAAGHEQLDEADRIPDPVWARIVEGFSRESGSGTEMSHDEITAALHEDEGYLPPDPGPIGVHTGPPLVVLCWVLAIGGALSLLFVTVVVRAVPALLVTVAVTSLVLGVLGLFWQLPKNRDSGGDDGAQV